MLRSRSPRSRSAFRLRPAPSHRQPRRPGRAADRQQGRGHGQLRRPRDRAGAGRSPTGKAPHEIAISPDGKQAAVVAYGDKTIDLFDVATRARLKTIDLTPNEGPHGIAWLKDGRIVVTTERSQSIAVVDPSAGTVSASIKTDQQGTHMVAVTADGTHRLHRQYRRRDGQRDRPRLAGRSFATSRSAAARKALRSAGMNWCYGSAILRAAGSRRSTSTRSTS